MIKNKNYSKYKNNIIIKVRERKENVNCEREEK